MIRGSGDSVVWSEISTEIKDSTSITIEHGYRLNVFKISYSQATLLSIQYSKKIEIIHRLICIVSIMI